MSWETEEIKAARERVSRLLLIVERERRTQTYLWFAICALALAVVVLAMRVSA